MRVLVTGDRNWTQVKFLWAELDWLHERTPITAIIEGCAPGADHAAEAWAAKVGIPNEHFPAEWQRHGGELAYHPPEWADIIAGCRCAPSAHYCSFAGYRRNEDMLFDGRPDKVAAFHSTIQQSRGTRHMALLASGQGVPVLVRPPTNDTHLASTIQLARTCAAPVSCVHEGCKQAQADRFSLYRYAAQAWRPTDLAWCDQHTPQSITRG